MPVLQQAQELYGYLPMEVQVKIAEGLDIPLEEVYGVVTFYAQFSLYPKGQYKISVCLGTACYVKGSGDGLRPPAAEAGDQGRRMYPPTGSSRWTPAAASAPAGSRRS